MALSRWKLKELEKKTNEEFLRESRHIVELCLPVVAQIKHGIPLSLSQRKLLKAAGIDDFSPIRLPYLDIIISAELLISVGEIMKKLAEEEPIPPDIQAFTRECIIRARPVLSKTMMDLTAQLFGNDFIQSLP